MLLFLVTAKVRVKGKGQVRGGANVPMFVDGDTSREAAAAAASGRV